MKIEFVCSGPCKRNLPQSEFYSSKRKDRLSTYQYRECKTCFRQRMNIKHAQQKLLLVEEHGGKCLHCGYSVARVLQFHHLEPQHKDFTIGYRPSANIATLRKEAEKCILLCPNCHAEKHLGVW